MKRFPWPVTLVEGRVTLRAFNLRDEVDYHNLRHRNAAWTGPWDATLPHDSPEKPLTFRQLVKSVNKDARSGRILPWVILYQRDGQAIPTLAGQMTLSGITYGAASWTMAGYWVDQALAGRGITPLALAMAADYAFFIRGIHRVEVAIRPENTASLRVVEKLGFRYEGSRKRYMHVDGDWRDHEMFALHVEDVGLGLVSRIMA